MSNAYNIKNLGDDCEKKIHHFDIHDQRIWENLDNKSKCILV